MRGPEAAIIVILNLSFGHTFSAILEGTVGIIVLQNQALA
jgi:hypothetical protein